MFSAPTALVRSRVQVRLGRGLAVAAGSGTSEELEALEIHPLLVCNVVCRGGELLQNKEGQSVFLFSFGFWDRFRVFFWPANCSTGMPGVRRQSVYWWIKE